jgi:hypothetical protein
MEVIPLLMIGMAAEIIAARQEFAVQEAEQRAVAENNVRQMRLDGLRTRFTLELRDAFVQLQDRDSLLLDDYTRLHKDCDDVLAALNRAQSEKEMWQASKVTPLIMREMRDALLRKRIWSQDGTQAQAVNSPQQQLAHLEQQFAQIAPADAARFDPTGHQEAERALAAARSALAMDSASPIAEGALAAAQESVQKHTTLVAQNQATWRDRSAEAEHAVGELHALIAGLKADPIVMKWHTYGVTDIETQAQAAEQALASGALDRPVALLSEAQARAQQIVAEANAAQIQAEQRDYITNSIAKSLTEMGFVVNEPLAEHPEHPATAKIIQAASSTGQGIAVSVPMSGQIWYDTNGYAEKTEAKVGGGSAVVCDEAENVLLEMHARLDAAFGVKMSEITWPGKDPNRALRKADQLPTSGELQRQESVR